uniref:Kinesin motor domain-containing protein n=1 Tax=Steinernema glaseri TaxID=37863 RepID=A0A1I7YY33_9BILA
MLSKAQKLSSKNEERLKKFKQTLIPSHTSSPTSAILLVGSCHKRPGGGEAVSFFVHQLATLGSQSAKEMATDRTHEEHLCAGGEEVERVLEAMGSRGLFLKMASLCSGGLMRRLEEVGRKGGKGTSIHSIHLMSSQSTHRGFSMKAREVLLDPPGTATMQEQQAKLRRLLGPGVGTGMCYLAKIESDGELRRTFQNGSAFRTSADSQSDQEKPTSLKPNVTKSLDKHEFDDLTDLSKAQQNRKEQQAYR